MYGGENIKDMDDYDDNDTEGMSQLERRQLKNALKESRYVASMDEDRHRQSVFERGVMEMFPSLRLDRSLLLVEKGSTLICLG